VLAWLDRFGNKRTDLHHAMAVNNRLASPSPVVLLVRMEGMTGTGKEKN
jgi:hypothetical protein